jgi:hypothetical protein
MSYLTSVDLEMFSGDHLTIQVTVIDTNTSLAKNLTALSSARWKVSKSKTAPASVSKTLGAGITLIDGPTGRLDIDLQPIDTATFKGLFIHELEITDLFGRVQTVMDGAFTINQDLVV